MVVTCCIFLSRGILPPSTKSGHREWKISNNKTHHFWLNRILGGIFNPTWRIIPLSKWLGSPRIIRHETAMWKGNVAQPYLRDLVTMVINPLTNRDNPSSGRSSKNDGHLGVLLLFLAKMFFFCGVCREFSGLGPANLGAKEANALNDW